MKCFSIFNCLVSLILAISCTGTIEDSSLESTSFSSGSGETFIYKGLIDARAVAHNKFEIDLRPYRDDFTNYSYELYVNEGSVPINVDPNNLYEKNDGIYTYTLSDLLPNTYYSFKLRAKHLTNESESEGENLLSGVQFKTFDNQVASFGGVGNVSLVPGAANSTILVKWTPALMEGLYVLGPFDPAYYIVSIIDADLGLQNINNTSFSNPGKIIKYVPDTVVLSVGAPPAGASPFNNPSSVIVPGLSSGKSYFVQVRAVHKVFYDAQLDGTSLSFFNQDSNTLVRKITMLEEGTITDISQNSLVLSKGSGIDAYSKIQAAWLPADGIFKKYRLYYRQYDANVGGDMLRPTQDIYNEVGDDCTLDVNKQIQCIEVDTFTTNTVINLLESYKQYQVKAAVCLNEECPIRPTVPNAALFTLPSVMTTEAVLIDFPGIKDINNPSDPNNIDHIVIDFDAPVIGNGFADSLDLYCIDPNDHENYIMFPRDGSQISGSNVANCDGLSAGTLQNQSIENINETNLSGTTQLLVKNVKNINSSSFSEANYCFSLVPAIRNKPQQVFSNSVTGIVRCINPEIAVPSQNEFNGLRPNCDVNGSEVTVSWSLPTAGVYNKFQVFWKEKNQDSFLYQLALSSEPGYTASDLLPGEDVSYTFQGSPGTVYEVGALAVAENTSQNLYSENNLGIIDCSVELPVATFSEWTRVFSVGPRIDGRYPYGDPSDPESIKNFSTDKSLEIFKDAFKLEQFTHDGKVLEIKPPLFNLQPGNYNSSEEPSLTSSFDGRSGEGGKNASKNGIISFAWKKVSLNSSQNIFENEQDLGLRSERVFGYRVYRSDNNRLSWMEVTDESGLLHHGDYRFFKPDSEEPSRIETEKMIFFTDYSVKYSESYNFIDRARVYWYKVIPVFDGKELKFSEEGTFPPNEIKIVLPPPNVALVNRKMANRQGCMSLGKELNKSDYYSCDYNGIGSVAKTTPWAVGYTKLDLGGDLFIDRNELGCQYTRGSKSPYPEDSSSYFKDTTRNDTQWTSQLSSQSNFKGASNSGGQFRGCNLNLESGSGLMLQTYQSSDFDSELAKYSNNLFGDCIGSLSQTQKVTKNPPNSFRVNINQYNIPAAKYSFLNDAENDRAYHFSLLPNFPNTGLLDEDWQQNVMVQSENFAVFYNVIKNGYFNSPFGPTVEDPSNSFRNFSKINTASDMNDANNCYINLAAIGSDTNWKARWVPTNHLDRLKESEDELNNNYIDIYLKTIDEIKDIPTLYHQDSNYKFISYDFINNSRINVDTPISRIFSSNHAKLPPLTGLTSEQYNKVCSTYSIQIGLETEQGDFVALTSPRKKRLPRRNEFILSSEFPEHENYYDSNKNDYIEWIEAEAVANGGGACNGLPGNPLPNTTVDRTPGSPLNTNSLLGPYLTGSSQHDGNANKHSEDCVSRYGVQDLIGNYAETESQMLYCDFSLDKLYLGNFTAGIGNINESIEIQNDYNRYFLDGIAVNDKNGNLLFEGGGSWSSYEVVDEESGYCSLVDSDVRRYDDENNFQNLSVFIDVFNPDGSVNTNLIKKEIFEDQGSVNSLRNGNGTFLASGPNSILPPLKIGSEYSLIEPDKMKGKYFSPIVGLPLNCGETSNNDPCGVTSGGIGTDNTLVSTQKMIDKYHPGQEDNFILQETYSSDIPERFGTERVDGGPDPSDIQSVEVAGVGDTDPEIFGSQNYTVITEIQLTNDVDLENLLPGEPIARVGEYTYTETPISQLDPNTYQLYHIHWKSDRSEPIRMKSGGSFSSSNNGRFRTEFHQNEADPYKTGRCVVLINTDEF